MDTTDRQFKAGMRRLLSGVSVIATAEAGQRHGLVATSVSSLSVEQVRLAEPGPSPLSPLCYFDGGYLAIHT